MEWLLTYFTTFLIANAFYCAAHRSWVTTDDHDEFTVYLPVDLNCPFTGQALNCTIITKDVRGLPRNISLPVTVEHHISPEDFHAFLELNNTIVEPFDEDYASFEGTTVVPIPDVVDCFGLGTITRQLDMRPGSSDDVNTLFYFSSRQKPDRVQVLPGKQFGLEWVDFKPSRRTVMIVHGFMSHSNASWVQAMTASFLKWDDVNVIVVDWSKGGNTWKYWRAVANTRRVGADTIEFMRQLIAATGAKVKDFHFVGHSLGAHIVSYVSYHIGIVGRITGLDPAQPCFRTASRVERLDETDADFVDVIHTNGRLLQKIGFGLPDPIGHADFYPNGGMKQPGCFDNSSNTIWSKLLRGVQQAICSHGRAYHLFTESLNNNNCSFRAHQWNLTYEGVNASIIATCDRVSSCSEMGITAAGGGRRPRASGAYFVLTTDKEPYCPTEWERRHPRQELLVDLRRGFRIDQVAQEHPHAAPTPDYADPDLITESVSDQSTSNKNWFWKIVDYLG